MSTPITPKSPFDIRLGSLVRDRITGFTGIAVSRVEYLTGCTQLGVQPSAESGKNSVPGTEYLDWQRLHVLNEETELVGLADTAASARHDGAGEAPSFASRMSPTR